MTAETLQFQAEVSKLLHIVTHSLYSEKEIFLRELISNASDACDKLRYLALTEPGLIADDPEFKITLRIDDKAKTLSIADNGIGMNREDLVEQLGTIARSGATAFIDSVAAADDDDDKKAVSLIGQFGVGFYSAFMVADKVEVTSRKAGEDTAWRWASDGLGSFTIDQAARAGRGTTVMLHLKKSEKEFLDSARLGHIIKTYSDHIALPIVIAGDGDEADLTANTASALWTRPKSEISAEQYKEFYHHVAHAFDEPWLTLHAKAEGKIEYTLLLFVPSAKPFDLFDPERRHRLKLYVKRVFITDECEGLVPSYLRFLRGIVDSEDLPLNVSRELLQNNPHLVRIRAGVVRRVLTELKRKAEKAPDEYATFWQNFGAVLKEGLYEDAQNRDKLLKLARFRATGEDGLISLDDYVGRMKPGQEAIYTITGDAPETLANSPQLEGFAAKGVDVLLLSDPVDDFWLNVVTDYADKPFRSVTRGGADLKGISGDEAAPRDAEPAANDGEIATLIAAFKQTLGEAVKDVRASDRLTESPVCLVADEGDMDLHLERLLKAHNQVDHTAKRILELNPGHALIGALAHRVKADGIDGRIEEAARLLLDQALIVEGEPLADPAAFARRLADFMAKGL